jgi:hypothetical protein
MGIEKSGKPLRKPGNQEKTLDMEKRGLSGCPHFFIRVIRG